MGSKKDGGLKGMCWWNEFDDGMESPLPLKVRLE
jgi:hypothetical protein